jgi:two-component system chemotaxis response regulator CheB
MARARSVIAVGASAGGVEALTALVRALPPDLAAPVCIVLHVPPTGTSVLPNILGRRGPLPARFPEDKEALEPGIIYVAPSDRHLLVEPGAEPGTLRARLTRGPTENGHRPAVDTLMRSAARAAGVGAVGVVLSGMLDDGTAGLQAIKRCGGVAVVQDPEEALFGGRPNSALENVAVDHVCPVAEIGPLVAKLASEARSREGEAMAASGANGNGAGSSGFDWCAEQDAELDAARMEPAAIDNENGAGTPSVYSCPECGGVLREFHDGSLLRFRCRTGHAYTPDSLLAEQTDALEAALWTALRALEETASLARRLRERSEQRGHHLAVARFAEQEDEANARAATIRQALMRGPSAPNGGADSSPDADRA